jgi:hypothetical protein
VTILLGQRGEHNIELELSFSSHNGYVFHDSRGFEAGDDGELKIVQDFVRSRSQEKSLDDKLHAIWFVLFRIHSSIFTNFPVQVLYSDGQRSAVTGYKVH